MAMHMLMKRGKRTVAKHFKDEGTRQNVHQQLNDFIDYLLDPKKPIDDFETLDWCRWLVAGGVTFEEFSKEVRRYNNAVTCGLVWTANFVAYRCRTCGISPCMSLCADCFQAGDHTGHDFNMFRSQAGGACDCGDINVMKSEGFCPRHGPEHTHQLPTCPPDLLTVAEIIMPKLVFRLVQHLRDNSRPDMLDTFLVAMNDAEEYVAFLHTLSDMGAAMRSIFTRVVSNQHLYKELTMVGAGDEYQQMNQVNYQAALDSLKSPPVPDEFLEIEGINTPLNHQTLLEELVFWTVKFEFPQKIVTLLLSILPDEQYKEAFTSAFIKHYSRVSVALVNSIDRQTISNRVVHVSVQLLSPERLAMKMVREYHLLHIMLASLDHMMRCILIDSGLNDPRDNFHMVVDCEKDTLREHCYWPIVSDLINVLSHKPVAQAFLKNDTLLDFWFGLVGYFQGMNLNLRQMVQHVEYEPDTYYAAFSAELEICSSPMWSLLVHCNGQGSEEYTRAVIRASTAALQDWFVAVNVSPGSIPNPLQISFHLPLHRYLAVFLSQAVRVQGLDLAELLPSHNYLQMLMIHPLQLQVVFQEIFCGMWVRNGLQIKGQAMTYIQCHFCNSMVDADLYLLQVCAAHLDPDYFTKTVLERFHVRDLLTFVPVEKRNQKRLVQTEHEMPMLEGALSLLTMLLSISTRLGMSESNLTRLEMLTLLCMSDRTHSQLMDLMPEKCGLTGHAKDFEPTLKDIAEYRAPNFEAGGTMQQGMYIPKGYVWEHHYDPLYVLLRAMHRKDFQQSMDRYATYMRNAGLYSGKTGPWPPFRLPGEIHPSYAGVRRLLHCRTMHGLIFTLLYKGVHEQNLPDAILYFSVFLLEMALTIPSPSPTNSEIQIPPRPRDKHFSEWFPTSNILANLCHTVGELMVTVEEMVPQSPTTVNSSSLSLIEPPSLINFFSPVPSTLSVSGGLLASFGGGTNIQHAITAAAPATTATATTQTQTAEISAAEIITSTIQDLLNQVSEQVPMAGAEGADNTLMVAPPTISMAATTATSTATHTATTSTGTDMDTSPSASVGTSTGTSMSTSTGTSTSTSTSSSATSSASSASSRQFTNQGVTADLDRQRRTFPVRVDENMISLLLKLHQKLGERAYIPPPYRTGATSSATSSSTSATTSTSAATSPSTSSGASASESESENRARGCRVGDGPYFISGVLDKAYERSVECAKVIEGIYQDSQPQTSMDGAQGKKETSDLEERRRRARERQKKLMEQFASKQKQFMEKIIGDSSDSEAAEELRRSMSEDPPPMTLSMEETYDCCICNQTTPSTEDRPLGLVTLLQPTSVLGQRQHTGGVMQLPVGDAVVRHPRNNCAEVIDKHFKLLLRHCEETSCLASVNIGWQGGVFAQTCGHYVHLDCHTSYMDSLKTQQVTSLQVSRGEYWCPLCRQLANTALPIAPDVGPAVVKPLPKTQRDLIVHIGHTMEQRPLTPGSTLSNAMGNVMENLSTVTYPKYKQCSKSHSAESVLLFVCSVLRTNLELELEQRKGKIVSLTKPSPKRACLVPLMQVLSMHSKVLMTKPYTDLWFHLTGVPIHPQHSASDSVAVYMEEVPLLLKDPCALLIQLVLTMPSTIDKEAYTCLVKAIYNVVYVQALAVVSCRFCDEERIAWKSKAKEAGFGSMGGLLAHVIFHLSQSSIYEDGTPVDPHIPALTHSVWSPQCVESSVEELCMPYLRMAALLQQHLYTDTAHDTTTDTQETVGEYFALCEYLHLVAPSGDASQRSSADAVHWFCEHPQSLVTAWAQHFAQFANKHSTTARTLLLTPNRWMEPGLFMLPYRYDEIFQHYRKRACPNCSSVPKDPALCLVCASLVCFKETCCRQQGISEAVQHAIDCGGGTGMFLIVNSSMIVVISGRRATLWGSVYLDEHGEEDRELKRGKPLYLSEERYKLLQQQWVQHTFEHVCKRWIFHQNRL